MRKAGGGSGRSSADEYGVRAWQVARGPEKGGDDWTVVFRMDDRAPDEERPQIVVTGCPMVATQFGNDGEEYESSYGNSVYFEYQVWDADGRLIASRREEDPEEYSGGWESESLAEAIERGQIAVERIAEAPDYWRWDGSAESLGP